MLEAGIETSLILRQLESLSHNQQQTRRKRRDFNAYVSLLICLHVYA